MNFDQLLASVCGTSASVRKFMAGSTVFSVGEPSIGVYMVVKGRVRLERITEQGKEAVLFVANDGDPFAEASIFSSVYHCSAIALTDVTVNYYPRQRLLDEFCHDSEFTQAYARMLGSQLMRTRTRLERANMNNASDRVRHFLALESGADGYKLKRAGALKDLAKELSLTPEALYRTLSQMAKAGEIKRTPSAIQLIGH